MKYIVPALSLLLACLTLSNCGGGGSGSGSDNSPPTVRPKSLEEITLTLDGTVKFSFFPNRNSQALRSGDIETGSFTYVRAGAQVRVYPNAAGTRSNIVYPDSVSSASYTYRAINDSSAVLTLTANGNNDSTFTGIKESIFGIGYADLFDTDSFEIPNNVVNIDLTFTGNGSFIISNIATVRIPGGDPAYDTALIPSSIGFTFGGFVPANYNPIIDPLRESRIAPASINNKLFNFRNGDSDDNLNFTIQFTSDNSQTDIVESEVGAGLLRISGIAIDNAINYTYERIPGTDDATLVISNADNTFDGSYTLRFSSGSGGRYIGTVDAGTLDAGDVSGTFTIPGSP